MEAFYGGELCEAVEPPQTTAIFAAMWWKFVEGAGELTEPGKKQLWDGGFLIGNALL